MGYCMRQVNSRFRIPAEKKAGALAAVKSLAGKGPWEELDRAGRKIGQRWSWVNDSEYVNATSVEQALSAWGWEAETDVLGNITDLQFEREKIGQEDELFDAIAPHVDAGSFIEMSGEDGDRWRWIFDGQECEHKDATITW